MTRIVGVHGIGNYSYYARSGSETTATEEISTDWAAALAIAYDDLGISRMLGVDTRVSYYAHLLHRGTPQGADDPAQLDDNAQDILISWAEQLIADPVAQVAQGPRTVRARAAADWITTRHGTAARSLVVAFCREISTYQSRSVRRQAVLDKVASVIAENKPRLIIAHSLGSVVAYEALWEHPELGTDLLLTLGSPLAMPGVIFDRLKPAPIDGRGKRPPGVASWVNLADIGDIIAVPRGGLANHFSGVDRDAEIIIGDRAFHGARYYLECADTARIVATHATHDSPQ